MNSSNNYFGFRLTNEAIGNQIQYGWMQISLDATAQGQPRAIVAFAYENSGTAIPIGFDPQPSTFALVRIMAAGALGVREWRKRKIV